MDLEERLKNIQCLDKEAIDLARKQWLSVAKPLFSLGKLEKAVEQIAGIKGTHHFSLAKKGLVIMCSDNGVVEEGVTQSGQDITAAVTENFSKGETSVCIMAKKAGADIFPIDIGVAVDVHNVTAPEKKLMYGTKNMTKEPAMSRDIALKAIALGIDTVGELKEKGYEILATGEMGIGNTTTSSAIASVLLGVDPEIVTGRGAGLSSAGLIRKIEAIKKAIAVNKPDKNDPIDVLAKVGGLDIAGLAGVFLGGAIHRVPIVIDGFISGVAALIARRIFPGAKDFMLPSHVSNEPAGQMIIEALELDPFVQCGMFLGEGTGAVLLFPLLDMAYSVYREMNTFDNWGHEKYEVLI